MQGSSNPNINGSGVQAYEIFDAFDKCKNLAEAKLCAQKYKSRSLRAIIYAASKPKEVWKKVVREHKFECDKAPDHFAVSSLHQVIFKIEPLIEGRMVNMEDYRVKKHVSLLLTSLIYNEAIVFHSILTGEMKLPKFIMHKEVLNVLGIPEKRIEEVCNGNCIG